MPKLDVEVRVPTKVANGNYATTVVIRLLGGGWPGGFPDHVDVTLFAGETSTPKSIPTNGNTIIDWDVGPLRPGSMYPVRVTAGRLVWNRRIITPAGPTPKTVEEIEAVKQEALAKAAKSKAEIAEAEKKVAEAKPKHAPAKLAVSAGRKGDNKYVLVIFVCDEHGHGIPHFHGTLRDNGKVKSFATDEHGRVNYTTEVFTDATRPHWIEVSAGVGHNLNWGQKLYKPS
ncbi:MAG: hypothetical protein NUV53_00745 [Patescibacteria group bacterium]|nr:hypothetical protein [Patescibacteria group bacterium]